MLAGDISIITRRNLIKNTAMLGGASMLPATLLQAFEADNLITRAIPKTGEQLPIVGLGSSATFRSVAQSDDISALTEVIKTLVGNQGTVLDTAPSYGASEEVSGKIARAENLSDKIFWATKVNAAGRGSNKVDPKAVQKQLQNSFDYLGPKPIDLIQVHNLAALPTQMGAIQELKQDGRVRYIGTTSTRTNRYPDLEQAMKDYPLDFIGVDYSVDNREAANSVLPLAQELGIAVLLYVPFGRAELFTKVKGVDVPEFAKEIGCDSWGKFFIKYVAANPAVTCVTPATSKAKHMLDNIGAAYGELPDAAILKKMEQFIDALPD